MLYNIFRLQSFKHHIQRNIIHQLINMNTKALTIGALSALLMLSLGSCGKQAQQGRNASPRSIRNDR